MLLIKHTITHSWHLLRGSKAALWGANFTILVFTTITGFLLAILAAAMIMRDGIELSQSASTVSVLPFALMLVLGIIIAPFLAGAMMVAIKRARNESVHFRSGYEYMHKWFPAAVTMVIMFAIVFAISRLFNSTVQFFSANTVLPPWAWFASNILARCVYTLFLFALPLIADCDYSALQAIIKSCRYSIPNWHKLFLLQIFNLLILAISVSPAFVTAIFHTEWIRWIGVVISVGLIIWVLPYTFLINGVAYQQITESD